MLEPYAAMNATVSKLSTSFLLMALAASPFVCMGQEDAGAKASTNGPAPVKRPVELKFKHESFTFVRIQYSPEGGRPPWHNDYPDADLNFSARFARETGLKTEPDGEVTTLTGRVN